MISNNLITVKTASKYCGYSEQFLRRILMEGTLKTTKIGQLWLIDLIDFFFKNLLKEAIRATDKRFGPHSGPPIICELMACLTPIVT